MTSSDAEVIRAALLRLNNAENSYATLSLEPLIQVIDEVCAPNCEGSTNGDPLRGRDEDRETERAMFTAFPDYQRRFDTIVIEPPFAAVRWTTVGTHTQDFPGYPASGNRVTATGMSLFEFENGRVRRYFLHFDVGAFLAQLVPQ